MMMPRRAAFIRVVLSNREIKTVLCSISDRFLERAFRGSAWRNGRTGNRYGRGWRGWRRGRILRPKSGAQAERTERCNKKCFHNHPLEVRCDGRQIWIQDSCPTLRPDAIKGCACGTAGHYFFPSECGCSSVVEHLLAKEDVASSSLVTRSSLCFGRLRPVLTLQLASHLRVGRCPNLEAEPMIVSHWIGRVSQVGRPRSAKPQ